MKIQILISGTYIDDTTFSRSIDNIDDAISALEDIQNQEYDLIDLMIENYEDK